jgi:BarA-like signal transduction histidine kinase
MGRSCHGVMLMQKCVFDPLTAQPILSSALAAFCQAAW